MKRRKKVLLGIVVFCLCFLAVILGNVLAQEESSSQATQQADYKGQIVSDRQAISGQKSAIKDNASAAHQEEAQLKQQIRETAQSEDKERAQALRDQLKSAHQENLQQKQQDIQAMHQARQEFKQDAKEARQKGNLPPRGKMNPSGYNPADADLANPSGTGGRFQDMREDIRDHREDSSDRREDVRDRREDRGDRREDIMDKREDVWDKQHDTGRMDKIEDKMDRREDKMDHKEDKRDRREDFRDRKENKQDRREDFHDRGMRPDKTPGQGPMAGGQGKGQGMHKPSENAGYRGQAGGPKGGGGSGPKGGAGKHR